MRAAMFYGSHQPLKIENVADPTPETGQLVVKVAACGLCHTDLHYIDHDTPTFHPPPLILGHEISGTVAAVGPDVVDFKEGDPVILPAVLPCRTCAMCRSGRENICENLQMYGNHINGGYAEYVLAWADHTFHLPHSIPLQEGAIIADAITTPYHAVVHRGRVQAGQSVAVIGCGGIGLNVVQFARAAGAGRIIAVDIEPSKLEHARELGATDTINAFEVDRVDSEIRFRTRGGVEIAFECIGRSDTQLTAMGSVRAGGRVVFVGYNPRPVEVSGARVMFRELEIVGSLGCRPIDYPRVIRLVEKGIIKLKELVSHRVPLEKINDGFDLLREGKALRAIVVP